MKTYDPIIIGAGLAGLSCAFELTKNGCYVLVLETNSYLGGITASWDEKGMQVDSALHKFLGFYTKLPQLLEWAGIKVDDIVVWEVEVKIINPHGGPSGLFGASPLGHPVETGIIALGNSDFLSLADKVSFVTLITLGLKDYYTNPQELDTITAAKHHISQPVIERVLRAFTEGIFFTP